MKSNAIKKQEAVARNAKNRPKYLEEAKEKFPDDAAKQNEYADIKQGIGKR